MIVNECWVIVVSVDYMVRLAWVGMVRVILRWWLILGPLWACLSDC